MRQDRRHSNPVVTEDGDVQAAEQMLFPPVHKGLWRSFGTRKSAKRVHRMAGFFLALVPSKEPNSPKSGLRTLGTIDKRHTPDHTREC